MQDQDGHIICGHKLETIAVTDGRDEFTLKICKKRRDSKFKNHGQCMA